jgi:hypothetical protein
VLLRKRVVRRRVVFVEAPWILGDLKNATIITGVVVEAMPQPEHHLAGHERTGAGRSTEATGEGCGSHISNLWRPLRERSEDRSLQWQCQAGRPEEGLDVNLHLEWKIAAELVRSSEARLPAVQ